MALNIKPGRRRSPQDLTPALIAPCGMNCGLCMGFLRAKNTCQGCRAGDEGMAKSCRSCIIRNCRTVHENASGFCFECEAFPCARLRRLDARYRGKYRMSMLENLARIKEAGIDAFIEAERDRWACPTCGGLQCVHRDACIYCGRAWGN